MIVRSLLCFVGTMFVGCETVHQEVNWIHSSTSTGDTVYEREDVTPGKVYTIDLLDSAPKRIAGQSPRYPYALRRERVTGKVICWVILDETGEPAIIGIETSTHDQFIEPAIEAMKTLRYTPGMIDGKAVKCTFFLPLTFDIP